MLEKSIWFRNVEYLSCLEDFSGLYIFSSYNLWQSTVHLSIFPPFRLFSSIKSETVEIFILFISDQNM